jgi:hypothetical protein
LRDFRGGTALARTRLRTAGADLAVRSIDGTLGSVCHVRSRSRLRPGVIPRRVAPDASGPGIGRSPGSGAECRVSAPGAWQVAASDPRAGDATAEHLTAPMSGRSARPSANGRQRTIARGKSAAEWLSGHRPRAQVHRSPRKPQASAPEVSMLGIISSCSWVSLHGRPARCRVRQLWPPGRCRSRDSQLLTDTRETPRASAIRFTRQPRFLGSIARRRRPSCQSHGLVLPGSMPLEHTSLEKM